MVRRRLMMLLIWGAVGLAAGLSMGGAAYVEASAEPIQDAIQRQLRGRLVSNGKLSPSHSSTPLLTPALVEPLYQQQAHQPIWTHRTDFLTLAQQFLAGIRALAHEGLSPRVYHLDFLERALSQGNVATWSEDQTATLDIMLSDAFLTAGTHLASGRLPTQKRYSSQSTRVSPVNLTALLLRALDAGRPAQALASLLPTQRGYIQLRQALARYRQIEVDGGWPMIPKGPILRRGDRDDRVALLRHRLRGLSGPPDGEPDSLDVCPADDLVFEAEDQVFDAGLEQLVRQAQQRYGLPVDGLVGRQTLAALNTTVQTRIEQIQLNLERWRPSPQTTPERYILVNVPDYTLSVMDKGESVLNMKVVVGKPKWRTPTFESTMTYLVLNPYWVVPQRIGREEIIPRVQKNPAYLARNQMEVVAGWGRNARVIDPATIDWATLSPKRFPYYFRQLPGDRNALGRVKFKFPNPFQVYLHDTSSRSLFQRPERAFSHGCVRLERPLELTAYLLQNTVWTPQRLSDTLAQGKRKYINLKRPIDVRIVYRTAWVDNNGLLQFRPDIYDHDKKKQKILCSQLSQLCQSLHTM